MAQQILFPWGSYKTAELARVLGVSRGKTLTALRRLGIVENRVAGKGIPADQTEQVRAEVERVAADVTAIRRDAAEKRAAKAARREKRKSKVAA